MMQSRLFLLLIAVFLIIAPVSAQTEEPTPPPDAETGTVTRIIDGDTIDVEIEGEVFRVRYIGIDTPERGADCYQDASDANAALVDGQTVTLVKDVSETDRFDRLLRYVYVGDIFVNGALVSAGYAVPVEFPPDTAHAEYFVALAEVAADNGYGCTTGEFGELPMPGLSSQQYFVRTSGNINARAEANTTSAVVASVAPRTIVVVVAEVEGEAVSGETTWYEAVIDEETVYIHSSLLLPVVATATPRPAGQSQPVQQQPAQQQPAQQQPTNTTAPVQQQPAQQEPAQPVEPPTQPPPPPTQPPPPPPTDPPAPAAPAFSCDCSKTCGNLTCEEAYFQLNQCGCGQRDGDGDGIPCESICGG